MAEKEQGRIAALNNKPGYVESLAAFVSVMILDASAATAPPVPLMAATAGTDSVRGGGGDGGGDGTGTVAVAVLLLPAAVLEGCFMVVTAATVVAPVRAGRDGTRPVRRSCR